MFVFVCHPYIFRIKKITWTCSQQARTCTGTRHLLAGCWRWLLAMVRVPVQVLRDLAGDKFIQG